MEHDGEDAACHCPPRPAATSRFLKMRTSTQGWSQRQSLALQLLILFPSMGWPLSVLSVAYAFPSTIDLPGGDVLSHMAIPTAPAIIVDLTRRSTEAGVIHDSFFIPGVAASGAVFLVGVVCCLLLLRKEKRPIMPPEPRPLTYAARYKAPPRPDQPPPSDAASVNTGRFSRQSKIQRKSMIQNQAPYGLEPLPQPPPSITSSYARFKQPVPGIPQHPGLAAYNPEPLPYANGTTQMRNLSPSGGNGPMQDSDNPLPVPPPRPRPTPVPPAGRPQSLLSDGKSSTQVGSDSAQSSVSFERGNRGLAQARYQPPPRQGASLFAVPAPYPPSPPGQIPPVNQQAVPSPLPSESALSYLSSERATRWHAAQAQPENESQYQPPPPEGASSFAVPAPNPPSPPAQLQPVDQQYLHQYTNQQQPRSTYSNGQGGSAGYGYQTMNQPPHYSATKSSGHSRRETKGG